MKQEEQSRLPHQERIVQRLLQKDQPGLILVHGLGSGKTRSSIEAYKELGLPASVVLPAALKKNYQKELEKWVGEKPKNVEILSQQELARKGAPLSNFAGKTLIVDEAHRIRNEASKLYSALRDAQAAKRVLLTGTPIYNHPSDIAKLINVAAGKPLLPEDKSEFESKFIGSRKVYPPLIQRLLGVTPGSEPTVKNQEQLKKIFRKFIDYHPGNIEGMPQVKDETVRVDMPERQELIYKALMGELPWYLRMKVTAGLPPNRKELERLVPFLSGARMLSNSTLGFTKDPSKAISPKVEKAFKFLKKQIERDPTYKGLIYSNYLESGIAPYKKLLTESNIPYGEFSGDIPDKIRQKLVDDYNANKLRALIVSSAGSEGLDLKGTRLVQILEPHFNKEKLKQVIGRAARYKSHEALPEDKQNVLVQNYLSSLRPSWLERFTGNRSTSADEYLQNLSESKEKLNEEFLKLIKR